LVATNDGGGDEIVRLLERSGYAVTMIAADSALEAVEMVAQDDVPSPALVLAAVGNEPMLGAALRHALARLPNPPRAVIAPALGPSLVECALKSLRAADLRGWSRTQCA
jgi:hypothetical protein